MAVLRPLLALVAVVSLMATDARAQLLQIIHTNDLHSYFEHAPNSDRGGYPAVKATIDRLRQEAEAQGIQVLVLDAGDFGDGGPLFLTDQGQQSWSLINAIGYDAVTLGNHDYLPGQYGLDQLIGAVKPNFKLLAANLEPAADQKNLRKYVQPYVELKKGGMRIAIMGLTNSEWTYAWRMGPGAIRPMRETWNRVAPELKGRNDLVIALTHLGLAADRRMVPVTTGADIVVGGHSHTFMYTPEWAYDLKGNPVPIVQAGEHGQVVGDLLVDVTPGKPLQIMRYQLVPVDSNGPKDPAIAAAVATARAHFEQQYGSQWLHEVLGSTEVTLYRPDTKNCREGTDVVVRGMREAAGVDMAMDNEQFYGANIPPGPITRESVMGLYPHIYGLQSTRGWTVWTAKVRGFAIGALMNLVLKAGYVANVSGVTFDIGLDKDGNPKVENVQVGGKPIKPWHSYSVAMPEGMGLWLRDATTLMGKVITAHLQNTGIPIWSAVEKVVREEGVIHHQREREGSKFGNLPGCPADADQPADPTPQPPPSPSPSC
ncbi:MAG TPA: bifunctional UDP-sugar hydrolase/5'-nucleotidase [Bdellovibrionota bacterium]|nr:bifunctional UDP-sugar hydrolase/5'-nucleotidase [Bdellovibrionota bacterium]